MPPFKRTETTFVGDTDASGREIKICHGDSVTILAKAAPIDGEDTYHIASDGQRARVFADDLFPSPDAPATNQEMMAHLMEFASTPMVHVFIFDAITKFADAVLADPEATRAKMVNGLVGPDLWMDSAREARDAVAAHLDRR